MPSTGVPAASRSEISPPSSSSSIRSIAFANAPTPGSTRPSASAASSGSLVITASAPTRSKAFSTERRLPIP